MELAIAVGLAVSIAGIGGAIGMGILGGKAFESIARLPEAADEIRKLLIISLAFVETLTIYGLVIALMLFQKMPS
ncbi:ATP synthase F0 subunit C [Syntrophomonas palmitatica]|uniref:ATP synthase F0 subunit C n=1 Tax=Syntrophomonas palmitatica TaxID=402877 RepID=UPI0006D0AB82|nr:ATP synthase F0 subunit C [Syntrophomonas palmitatica]